MSAREKIARWLAPDLARRADERDKYVEAFEEASRYDAKEADVFRYAMIDLHGRSFGPKVPKRPIDPAIAATIDAGHAAIRALGGAEG